MQLLNVANLVKRFPDQARSAVNDVSFTVEEGEIFSLLGPSGCGKTTTLRMIGGFEEPDSGTLEIEGVDIAHLPPEQRQIGIVFQDYALFPHLSVADNVMFGLRHLPRRARREEAETYLGLVGLEGMGDRMPQALSGGQQQRVALARSLAAKPRLILLDEPFSNLDAGLRQATRNEVRTLLKAHGISAILVTHDQEEALSFSDRLALMREGEIEQIGTPEEVYHQPRTPFAAEFLGRTNLIMGMADGEVAETALGQIPISQCVCGQVLLSIRPEHLTLEDDSGDQNSSGVVINREFKGHDMTHWVRVGDHEYQIDTDFTCPFRPGSRVRLKPRCPAVVLEECPNDGGTLRPTIVPAAATARIGHAVAAGPACASPGSAFAIESGAGASAAMAGAVTDGAAAPAQAESGKPPRQSQSIGR